MSVRERSSSRPRRLIGLSPDKLSFRGFQAPTEEGATIRHRDLAAARREQLPPSWRNRTSRSAAGGGLERTASDALPSRGLLLRLLQIVPFQDSVEYSVDELRRLLRPVP